MKGKYNFVGVSCTFERKDIDTKKAPPWKSSSHFFKIFHFLRHPEMVIWNYSVSSCYFCWRKSAFFKHFANILPSQSCRPSSCPLLVLRLLAELKISRNCRLTNDRFIYGHPKFSSFENRKIVFGDDRSMIQRSYAANFWLLNKRNTCDKSFLRCIQNMIDRVLQN